MFDRKSYKMFDRKCYECIKTDKTEQDWSFNQFAVNINEFSV